MKLHSLAPPGPIPQVQPDISGSGGGRSARGKVAPRGKSIPKDLVDLSPEARSQIPGAGPQEEEPVGALEFSGSETTEEEAESGQLSEDEQKVIRELQARDTEVRAHEAAHASAAGGLGGSASFSYTTGPDGRQYAVGGEVPIDMSSGSTPQETISRAQTIRAAALAPADPSGQDYAVAAAASQMESDARVEVARQAEDSIFKTVEVDEAGKPVEPSQGELGSGTPRASSDVGERLTSGLQVSNSHEHLQSDCGFCVRAVSAYES